MASYMREADRLDRLEGSLPSIRTSMRAWEAPARRPPGYEEVNGCVDERVRVRGMREEQLIPRPPSPSHSRRHVSEMSDQLRFMKDEVTKKDRLISQLTSMENPRTRSFDTAQIDEFYSAEKMTAIANARSDVAALQVRTEGLQNQLRETQARLEAREDKVKELNIQIEIMRESESKQNMMVSSLRGKLTQFEAQADSMEGVASRSEVAIHTLQKECSDYQKRILELEDRLKQQLENRELAEHDRSIYEKRYREIITHFSTVFHTEGLGDPLSVSPDFVITRFNDLANENAMLRGKVGTLQDHTHVAELESKASRETIMRMVTDQEREQHSVTRFQSDMQRLSLERDTATERQKEMEREVDLLKDRLEASQRAWQSTKRELDERESRFQCHERDLRDNQALSRNIDQKSFAFREMLASVLSDNLHTMEPNEELIRDRVANMAMAIRDKTAHIDMLELKVDEMSKQLHGTVDLQRSHQLQSKRMEVDFLGLEDKLRKYEGELAAGDMMRDGMRTDKDRYMRFLEMVVRAMKMDTVTMELGVESITDAIVARCEQLVRNETESLVDRKTHIYNLQRKIKSLKEQLESKDLHMELLRKKGSSLEERMLSRNELDREKEDQFIKSRKMEKVVGRYKCELNEARLEIRDLKARLLESSDIRCRTVQQEQEIESLEAKVGQLETVRQRQASKLNDIKHDYDSTLNQFTDKKSQAQSSIQALSSELRTTKQSLDETGKREKTLLDLRQVLARMLGLDVNTLAIPDYEIIARLEKLIMANQANASTAVVLDTHLQDVGEGFRAGYEDASRALTATSLRASRPPRRAGAAGAAGRVSLRQRPRSASPTHTRRDKRAY